MELKELDRLIKAVKDEHVSNLKYYKETGYIEHTELALNDTLDSDEGKALIKYVIGVDE